MAWIVLYLLSLGNAVDVYFLLSNQSMHKVPSTCLANTIIMFFLCGCVEVNLH